MINFLRNITRFFLLIPFIVLAQQEEYVENDSLLLWQSNRSLEWKDFKGKQLNHYGNVLAETHGDIRTVNSYWLGGTPRFDVRCYFLKCNSWTITEDSVSLEHEQIHFNIYELFTRKIRKVFAELNQKGVKDFEEYNRVFNEYLKENSKYNETYDIDVVTVQEKQDEWQTKIAKELEELKEYEYIPEQ